jgi:hypothetical protein
MHTSCACVRPLNFGVIRRELLALRRAGLRSRRGARRSRLFVHRASALNGLAPTCRIEASIGATDWSRERGKEMVVSLLRKLNSESARVPEGAPNHCRVRP